MPIDKAVDSAVLDANLLSVANAIREKAGTSETMPFPDGFVSVIEAIASGGSGLDYDMGEFVLDADVGSGLGISVPHKLGVVPEFICVWTDNWAGRTSEEGVSYADLKKTAVGFIWLDEITGMSYRASSTSTGTPFCVGLEIVRDDYRVTGTLPSSGVYGISDDYLSEYTFSPPNFGAGGAKYRAGVTYKYFVSKAWWNVGGVANA